ncbi:MAG: protease SohB [Proteobacteria bacterium]|jgi:serine protease SohB|nr:protease SohB [Pseudomonadota bacterium]
MEFLFEYGLFAAKVVTILIGMGLLAGLIASSKQQNDEPVLEIKDLNKRRAQMRDAMAGTVLSKKANKALAKSQKKTAKDDDKQDRPKVYVVDFDGDIKASGVETLRDEITAILTLAEAEDEVVVRLDNSGGIVHEHGLAASQLNRFKQANINLTVCVDKVAASGGYMMACVADKIVAAPFAVIGSIGVLAQLPNFNKLLGKAGIDYEEHTAGEFKRTVTIFGENTDEKRAKLNEQLEDTHTLFKQFVLDNRPKLDLQKVATGEHWYGQQAIDLGLVDALGTSDDYLAEACDAGAVFEIDMIVKEKLADRLMSGFGSRFDALMQRFY